MAGLKPLKCSFPLYQLPLPSSKPSSSSDAATFIGEVPYLTTAGHSKIVSGSNTSSSSTATTSVSKAASTASKSKSRVAQPQPQPQDLLSCGWTELPDSEDVAADGPFVPARILAGSHAVGVGSFTDATSTTTSVSVSGWDAIVFGPTLSPRPSPSTSTTGPSTSSSDSALALSDRRLCFFPTACFLQYRHHRITGPMAVTSGQLSGGHGTSKHNIAVNGADSGTGTGTGSLRAKFVSWRDAVFWSPPPSPQPPSQPSSISAVADESVGILALSDKGKGKDGGNGSSGGRGAVLRWLPLSDKHNGSDPGPSTSTAREWILPAAMTRLWAAPTGEDDID
jgi:hypothetical protein